MKPTYLGPFLGINNRLPDFKLSVKDGDFVRQAVNVDLTNAGSFTRRYGKTLLAPMTDAHSIYRSGSRAVLVRGGVLYAITLPSYSETMVKLLQSDDPMSYVEYNGDIYFSNGTDSGRISVTGQVYPWALPTPAQPVVEAVAGTLSKGWYQVGITYANATTGEEGGSDGTTNFELTAPGAMRVTLPAGVPGATHINVYVSGTNGETPCLYASVPVGTLSLDITTLVTTRAMVTAYQKPLPAGSRLFVHMGRLCSVKDDVLYYGPAYRLGYYEPSNGYIPFPAPISVAVPNQMGVYVAADKTYWLPGDLAGPESPISDVLQYGAVQGSEFVLQHNSTVGWMGLKGFVLADTQGQAQAVMTENVEPTLPTWARSGLIEVGGIRRVVCAGYCINVESKGVTNYTDYDFTSFSAGYGTMADGLYIVADPGSVEQVLPLIDFGHINFGTDQLKDWLEGYIGLAASEPMTLTITTPEGDEYEYDTRTSDDALKVQRFDPGRGLRAAWFGVKLSCSIGTTFTLASIGFLTNTSQRRL